MWLLRVSGPAGIGETVALHSSAAEPLVEPAHFVVVIVGSGTGPSASVDLFLE